jgi:hypothetical protein
MTELARRSRTEDSAAARDGAPALIVIARRQVIRVLVVCMSLLIVAGLAGQLSTWFLGHDNLLGFVPKFNLDAENNVPTWFSTICLFLCAIVLAVIALSEWRGKRPLCSYWFGLAGTFVLLSLDEAASFHEMLVTPLRTALHTGGFFYFAWVIPGGLFVLGFLLVYLRFLSRIPAETRRGFLLAGFVYCFGSLGMEMIDGRYASLHGVDFTYSLMSLLEESLEMAGEILFLRALLAHIAGHIGGLTFRLRED